VDISALGLLQINLGRFVPECLAMSICADEVFPIGSYWLYACGPSNLNSDSVHFYLYPTLASRDPRDVTESRLIDSNRLLNHRQIGLRLAVLMASAVIVLNTKG